ncbi:hypothetical protein AOLI_G00185950 [Acnodon oligacanthus]
MIALGWKAEWVLFWSACRGPSHSALHAAFWLTSALHILGILLLFSHGDNNGQLSLAQPKTALEMVKYPRLSPDD